MKYDDKFTMTQEDASGQNKQCLKDALDALYATYITNEIVAAYRGKAIQNINNIARALGHPDIVRND